MNGSLSGARRRSTGILAATLAVVLLSGCGEAATLPNLPAEQDVPLCAFRSLVDGLQEPAPHDAAATLRWALALQSYAEHTRLDRIPPKTTVPHQVSLDLQLLRGATTAYVHDVQLAAGSTTKLDAAFATLATAEFTRAVSDIYGWVTSNCGGTYSAGAL